MVHPGSEALAALSAPPLNEASIDTYLMETPPQLLQTRFGALARLVTSLPMAYHAYPQHPPSPQSGHSSYRQGVVPYGS